MECLASTGKGFAMAARRFHIAPLFVALALAHCPARAQVNVLTAHNDIARTGQNLNETVLTPANVNPAQFGKLFTHTFSGRAYAQPLYVSQVAIPNRGAHNVIYLATDADAAYAFDADTNGGANAPPIWHVSFLTNSPSFGTLTNNAGVWGTPVIDPSSQTMYLVSSEFQGSNPIFRFHALDIATGAEKFGGPLLIQASVAGTGSDSTGGILAFDAAYERQRSGLLLLNGVVYVPFGSDNDEGAWHGWIFSFAANPGAASLKQIDAFCTTPYGIGGGIWMAGSAPAAEVYNSAKPYGRMFLSTGNGTYSTASPHAYSMSILDLDLTGGVMTVEDEFTPFNESTLNHQDADVGSGGVVLLPTQTMSSGKTLNPLVQVGKSGLFYILDRDNSADGSSSAPTDYSPAGLGGFNATADQVVQEVQTPLTPGFNWGAGVWGTEAYWNNNIYSGGTNMSGNTSYVGLGNSLTAYSFVNGVLSSAPTSQSVEQYYYPGPTPSVSANGNTNGIVWALMTYPQANEGPETLLAYDATNLGNTLYSSATNSSRDTPGAAVKYVVPTIANGKVYVGAFGQVSVYGLLGTVPTSPAPVISPASGAVILPQTITITDADPNATIYYTTNGSLPNVNSPVYTGPFVVTTNETITAIASRTGYIASSPATATYLSTTLPTSPAFSLAAGTYSGAQTLTITSTGAVIYYTLDGSVPVPATGTTAIYSQPLTIANSETVRAIAVNPGPYSSSVTGAAYFIEPAYSIDFSQGFTFAQGPMQFNGSTDLDDFRMQLTNGGTNQAGSAFYATPVNIQQFTTAFTFQLSGLAPIADGMTFTIQNTSPAALGRFGGNLGYGGIPKSLAIKFDLYSNAGEGPDSTGLFLNGVEPNVPAINLTGTGIDLHSGDYFDAILTYDGTNLTLILTDAVTFATWSNTWAINIPATVGGNTAYVGFTGGDGGLTSSQKVTSWTYLAGPPMPRYPAASGFTPGQITLNGGAAYAGSQLELTDGGQNESVSSFFNSKVNVQQFSSSFDFQLTNPNADGFTFTIQGDGPTALGSSGGGLGYRNITKSVAVKFDLYNNDGEGPDSTGLYLNGAAPNIPAIDLTSTGVNLHSGDPFNVLLTYDGTTLTEVITDSVTGAMATESYAVNIPSIVGGPTAYVGFTAGDGGSTSIQQILDWSFTGTP
jgi:hypothetical protein